MKNKYLFLFLLGFFGISVFGQGNTADTMQPFCAGGSTLTFPNTTNSPPADPNSAADSYGCLGSEPNPAWFFMQIAESGNLDFLLTQVNTSGTPVDVDFILWGPFDGPPPIFGPANLNNGTQVDCSYSAAATENVNIPNAQQGDFYVILITNFSNQPGQISLTQTNSGQAGAGATDCDIVCPLDLGADFEYCPGVPAFVTASIDDATSYEWFLDGVAIPGTAGQQTITVTGPGVYSVIVNKPGCVEDATDSVTVLDPTPFGLGVPETLTTCGIGPGPFPFNLTQNNTLIRNGLNQFQYPISFYHNLLDAQEAMSPIPNPTTYTTFVDETIYVRIENVISGCYETVSFLLDVTDAPEANMPPTMYGCDDDDDGMAVFNLTDQDGAVLAGQDPDDYVIAYFTSQANADANTNAIATPTAYNGNGLVYVRITSVDDVDCYSTTVFNLDITTLPDDVVSPTPVAICDDIQGDNTAVFDLSDAFAEIQAAEPGMILDIVFYETDAEAQAGGGTPFTTPDYTTDEQLNQTIYFRVSEEDPDPTTPQAQNCFVVVPMNLTVNQKPQLSGPIPNLELCEDPTDPNTLTPAADGIEVFDLTSQDDFIIDGNPDLAVTYFTLGADAENNVNPITNPGAYPNVVADNDVVFVRVVNTVTTCYDVFSFNLVVHPFPSANTAAEFDACEEAATPGQGIFNLTSAANITEVTGGALNVTVAYYATEAAALLGGAGLPSLYTSPDATIYARVTDTNTGCWRISPVILTVTLLPVLGTPTPVNVCDAVPNDGIAQFDLTNTIAEILNGQTGLTVTMHASLANAQSGANPLSLPLYTNTASPNQQTVYFRVVDTNNALGCYSTTQVLLTVDPVPTIPVLLPIILCEDPTDPDTLAPMADGIEEFDLTIYEPAITGGNPDLVVSYYTSDSDAQDSINPITNPGIYPNAVPNLDVVFVRVDNTVTNCFDTKPLTLRVNPFPNANTAAEFHACEEVPGQADFNLADPAYTLEVTEGASNVAVLYYGDDADALAGGTNTLPTIFISPATTIYARVVNTLTGCFRISPVALVVEPAPIAPVLTALEECDFDNNSVAAFDLTGTLNGISTALGNVIVTAHETFDDADFHQNGTQGANPITNLSAYTNILDLTINGTQTLYILVQSADTECYDIAELQLVVHHVPEATTPQPYALCDNGLNDTDGIAIFDLTSVTPEVLGTISPANHTVTYHLNMDDATLNQNAIGTPAGYPSTSDTLYVRVTETATGCYDIVELELIVNPLPVANNPEPYTLCDVNNPGDEREVFDLTSRTEEIIILADGTLQDGINLTFHHTLGDAQGGINSIATPNAYINQTTVEAIYVRVTVEATGCYRVVLLDIRVEPLPLLVAPSDDELAICDPDADGFAQFDLEALVADMVNNAPNLVVRFYESAIDAANNQNAIPNPDDYTNIVPFAQTIYVRVENTVTGCFTTTAYALDLVVVPSPQLPDLSDLTLCDTDANNQNAITAFNLTSQNAIILAALGGTAADYTITYYTSEANAQNGAPRITNTTAYQGQDGQQIWVRVVDNTNPAGCFSVGTFFLRVNIPLALAPSHLWTKCNSELPNDTSEVFDLTLMDDTILGPFGVGLGYTVNYYTTDPRVNPAATPITPATAYTNPTNPVTLFVEVVTTGEGDCKSYTTLTLRVLPLPTPNFAPEPLTMCDNNNSPDGVEVFDLTLAAADIINNEPNLVLSYHTTLEDANNDVNAIAVPTAYQSGTATIYVRVEANTNNPANAVCYQVVELELIVNPLPALGENGVIPAFAQCEPNTDGRGTFILSDHIPAILGADANPDDYTVRFYFDQAALAAGTALPNQYSNIASPQQIVVWVRHDQTGCIATGTMDLLVEEAAIANTPDPAFLETCDDDGTNDGVHTFDLSLFTGDILGAQSPADYSVSYYESQEDAENNTNVIGDPANYTNGFSPYLATIYARVTNTSTISGCYALTTVELIVEALPEPNITSEGGQTICVDFKTGVVINPLTLYSNVTGTGYTYQWYLNGTLIAGTDPSAASYDATVEGDYTVVVTGPSHLACVSDMSAAFTVIKSGPASPIGEGFTVSGAFSDNQVIEVYVEGYGEYEYRLDEDGPWQAGNVFTNVSPGDHIIYVRDVKAENPCDMIEIHSVSVIDYPNYFTPNGDGYHDTWNIIGLASQEDAKIYIFDRYGKLIKQIASNGDGWDGTYNGAQLPADDYWFTVTYRETVNGTEVVKEFKSHFAMKR